MFTAILDFILKYKFIFLFYIIIIIFLILHRKRIDVQGKIILLYRTKFGLKWIEKFSTRFREWVILLGYIGVGVAYIGMIFISYILLKNLYDLLFTPQAVSGVSVVLPGISVPGLGVLPFWHWLIAIFVIAVVHEFSHGIVARAHKIEVQNTGLAFFGPIIGAFVEPNEKKMAQEDDIKQYSVLAAGPFSNILLGILAVLLLAFIFTPWQQSMTEPTGFTFDAYHNDTVPIALAGIAPGTLITGVNALEVSKFQDASDELSCTKPGEKIEVRTNNGTFPLMLGVSPDNPKKGFMGITGIRNEFETKEAYAAGWGKMLYVSVDWFSNFLRWLFLLSLGIGLFNLLPLPIVDGGRMVQISLWKLKGKEKGQKWFGRVSLFFLLLLVIGLVFPWISKLFGA